MEESGTDLGNDSHLPDPDRVVGCLWGLAVGDAVGLAYEGISRRRQRRLLAWRLRGTHEEGGSSGPERPRLLPFGRGMVSDDTDHACFVAQAIATSGGDPEAFARDLARRLRWWLAAVPAGIGFATLKATLRLWVGVRPERSGVFSAGNGPAMRAPLIGVCWGHDPVRMAALVRASTRLTHTDPKAEAGALAVAVAASVASDIRVAGTPEAIAGSHRGAGTGSEYLQRLERQFGLSDWFSGNAPPETKAAAEAVLNLARRAKRSAAAGHSTADFATELGLCKGVSGYIFHTVPVALHAWLAHPGDLRCAVRAAVACGGDTDTVAAVVGGISGAEVGRHGVPQDWLQALLEWPRGVGWMATAAATAAEAARTRRPLTPPEIPPFSILPRNAVFLGVVLAHGLRRLLPPY